MNIDTLLATAKPSDELSLREHAELHRLIEAAQPRRRPRVRVVIGIVAGTVLLVAGGVAATAAAGVWHHPTWYDAASDWTTNVQTVHLSFVIDQQPYHCTIPVTLSSTFDGKGTPDFQKALAYMQATDLANVKPDPATIADLNNSIWVGQGDPPPAPSKPFVYEEAWIYAVQDGLTAHLTSIGLDPQKVALGTDAKCDFTR
jgi:hypothetical protein